uniref:Plexin domain containing 1 n=1 Tax=Xiphophorus couchianus TaxID=32473 RepID=A0A3B5MUV8_9TELE
DQRTQDLWFDMTDVRHGQVRVHSILSNSYKQAVRVALSFDFPFYGHFLRQITIATGGFIFTGDVIHRMLTTTQYIAPLMANFDPSYSKDSTVQYLDNGEVFVVQWERVRLPGKESAGGFTFQAALYKTGRISFSYRDIPLTLDVIGSPEHPVKAGLSDAFMVMSSTSQSPGQDLLFIHITAQFDISKMNLLNGNTAISKNLSFFDKRFWLDDMVFLDHIEIVKADVLYVRSTSNSYLPKLAHIYFGGLK